MKTKQERKDQALEEYRAIKNPAYEAYEAIKNPAWEAYRAIIDPAWEAYEAKCKEIDAEEEEPVTLAEAEALLGRKIVAT